MSELPIDPAKSPLLDNLLNPGAGGRSAPARADPRHLGKRAPSRSGALIELLRLSHVVAAPLRARTMRSDPPRRAQTHGAGPGVLSSFALQAFGR